MRKIIITFLCFFVAFVYSQEYKTIDSFSFSEKLELDKKDKIFKINNLMVDNKTNLKVGDKIVIGPPAGDKFNTVFIDKFSNKTLSNFNLGLWAPFPILYRNNEFEIEEILLINIKNKLTPVINFKKDQLKGFCLVELSLKNNEIILK